MQRHHLLTSKNSDSTNNNADTDTVEPSDRGIAKTPGSISRPSSRNGMTDGLTSTVSSTVVEAVSAVTNLLRWSPTHTPKRSIDGGSSFSSEESANASDKNCESPSRKPLLKKESSPSLEHLSVVRANQADEKTEQETGNQHHHNGMRYRHSINVDTREQPNSFLYKKGEERVWCETSEVNNDSKSSHVNRESHKSTNVTIDSSITQNISTDTLKPVSSGRGRSGSGERNLRSTDRASDSASSKSSTEYRHRHSRERSFEKSLENILDKCSEKSVDLSVESRNGGQSDVSKSYDDSSVVGSSKKGDKKKRSTPWYTVLNPTYKSKSEDFKKLFKDVPSDERLVVDYSCAMQKEILVQGRMYITQNWICFYANIFRWETVLTIQCKEITSITKEKTARVIPNAIQIGTEKEKYFFTSLGNRDKTYMMLFRIWQNALMGQPMLSQELWQWIHYNYGEDLCLTTDDEDYMAPDEGSKDLTKCKDIDDAVLVTHEEKEEGLCEEGSFSQSMDTNRGAPVDLPTDQSDTTEDEGTKVQDEVVIPPEHKHFGRCYLDEVYTIPVDKLYEMMFTQSDFYMRLFDRAGRKDLQYAEWHDDASSGMKKRQITYTIPLNYSIGPKSSQTEENQIFYNSSKPGSVYLIDSEVYCFGIPYGDTFMVKNRYTISRITSTKSRIKISIEIRYRKSVWNLVKSMIEKNSYQGCVDYYNMLAAHLNQEAVKYETSNNKQPVKRKLKKKRSRIIHQPVPKDNVKHKLPSRHLSMMEKPTTNKINFLPPQPSRSKHGEDSINKINAETLVRVILVVLVLLVMFNAVLFYKLWSLESYSNFLYFPHQRGSIKDVQNYPKTQEDWVNLLQQQQHLHEVEIDKWNEVLSSSISLIDQMRVTLVKLKGSLEHKMHSPGHSYTEENNNS